ncbi:unnamed protein product [Gordionus sp. m RMFG-2023]
MTKESVSFTDWRDIYGNDAVHLSSNFRGLIRTRFECPNCKAWEFKDNSFYQLCIDVKNCDNLENAILKNFSKRCDAQTIEICPKCRKTVKLLCKTKLLHVPNILTIQLRNNAPAKKDPQSNETLSFTSPPVMEVRKFMTDPLAESRDLEKIIIDNSHLLFYQIDTIHKTKASSRKESIIFAFSDEMKRPADTYSDATLRPKKIRTHSNFTVEKQILEKSPELQGLILFEEDSISKDDTSDSNTQAEIQNIDLTGISEDMCTTSKIGNTIPISPPPTMNTPIKYPKVDEIERYQTLIMASDQPLESVSIIDKEIERLHEIPDIQVSSVMPFTESSCRISVTTPGGSQPKVNFEMASIKTSKVQFINGNADQQKSDQPDNMDELDVVLERLTARCQAPNSPMSLEEFFSPLNDDYFSRMLETISPLSMDAKNEEGLKKY